MFDAVAKPSKEEEILKNTLFWCNIIDFFVIVKQV